MCGRKLLIFFLIIINTYTNVEANNKDTNEAKVQTINKEIYQITLLFTVYCYIKTLRNCYLFL